MSNAGQTNITIVCGGPSGERGISINSARSIYDHLSETSAAIDIIYVDKLLRVYRIARDMLYSNTPDDFDHKLKSDAGSIHTCLLYTSPSPRDRQKSRMPSSA